MNIRRYKNKHFDLKDLYSHELEQMSKMTLIKRFSIRNDLYDKIIEHPGSLVNINQFLNPLFRNNPEKVYNLNKSIQYQKPLREKNVMKKKKNLILMLWTMRSKRRENSGKVKKISVQYGIFLLK